MTAAEDVVDLEKELHGLISRKQTAEQNIVALEARLYELETEYIRETRAGHGSILKSLDGYHGLRSIAPNSNGRRASGSITEADRIFSRTSSSWNRSVGVYRSSNGAEEEVEDDDLNEQAASLEENAADENESTSSSSPCRSSVTSSRRRQPIPKSRKRQHDN